MENIYNYKIITTGNMSGNLVSISQDLSVTNGYGIYAKWTGSPVGTIKLQATLDGINFIDYPGSATSVNNAGDALWEVSTAFYGRVQVVYTFTSGSGTLNVQILGKGDQLS